MKIFNKYIRRFVVNTAHADGQFAHHGLSVTVLDGNLAPTVVGRKMGYYDKTTGKPCRRTTGNTEWKTSTRRIEVGKDWLFENLPENLRAELFCELAGIE
jgi:autotransporter adhesin